MNAQAISTYWLGWGDTPWYLNRAMLINRGIWPEFYVYTIGHPIAVSLFERLTGDLVIAGVLVNRIGTTIFLLGTYLVGRVFFNRQIGYFAFLMVLCSAFLRHLNRLLQPFILFYSFTILIVLALWLTLKRPNYWSGLLLGLALNLCFFTRFEGISYCIVIPFAGLYIYRHYGWRQSLKVVGVSGITSAIGIAFYLSVLLGNADVNNGDAFSFLALMRQQPFPIDAVIMRLVQTFNSLTYSFSPMMSPLVWLVALTGAVWGIKSLRASLPYIVCLLLLLVNFFNQFVLSIEPVYRQSGPVYPIVAILFVDAIIRLMRRFPSYRYLALLPILLVTIREPFVLLQLSTWPNPDHRQFPLSIAAQNIDEYLQIVGLKDREIYTYCGQVSLFSQSNLQVIYRLAFRDLQSRTWWNSPENLFARMASTNALYMDCPEQGAYYRDWRDWIEGKWIPAYTLERVGEVDGYQFYRALPIEEVTAKQ